MNKKVLEILYVTVSLYNQCTWIWQEEDSIDIPSM